MSPGVFDRLINTSVERALRVHPRRATALADEHRYASPSVRAEVEAVAAAALRLVRSGLCASCLGSVAVRRSPTSAMITRQNTDLTTVDNRHLETVEIDQPDRPVLRALLAGHDAAVWGTPPSLMALASLGRTPDPLSLELDEAVGPVTLSPTLDGVGSGLTVVVGHGVLSGHDTASEAVSRLEAAELLAAISIARDRAGRNPD